MAQFYTKNERSAHDAFEVSHVFILDSEACAKNSVVYLEVLGVFRRIFKGVKYRDLFA